MAKGSKWISVGSLAAAITLAVVGVAAGGQIQKLRPANSFGTNGFKEHALALRPPIRSNIKNQTNSFRINGNNIKKALTLRGPQDRLNGEASSRGTKDSHDLHEQEAIGITYNKVTITHNIAKTSATDDWDSPIDK